MGLIEQMRWEGWSALLAQKRAARTNVRGYGILRVPNSLSLGSVRE
jgi:hypothetical protein